MQGYYVLALAASGTNLYAGGNFTQAGFATARNIAKWNGRSWSALGQGVDDTVEALAVSGTNLYVGGDFRTAGITVNCIAKWDGMYWSGFGSGVTPNSYPGVYALALSGTSMYAGGLFQGAGSGGGASLAKWDGNTWVP